MFFQLGTRQFYGAFWFVQIAVNGVDVPDDEFHRNARCCFQCFPDMR